MIGLRLGTADRKIELGIGTNKGSLITTNCCF